MIPKIDSIADKIGQYINKYGKCSREQIYLGLEGRGHYRDSVKKVITDMINLGQITHEDGVCDLGELLRKHYEVSVPVQYVGEIVPSRTASVFKPMTVTPWAQHLDKLREVSFKNGSTDFRAFVGYLAG